MDKKEKINNEFKKIFQRNEKKQEKSKDIIIFGTRYKDWNHVFKNLIIALLIAGFAYTLIFKSSLFS